MSTYGLTVYGTDLYGITYAKGFTGPQVPSGYDVSPFTAEPVNYQSIGLSWQQPTGAFLDFRLLRSRYGFPVDQNDGTVLEDSGGSTYPGSLFLDTEVIPGTYHYYGIYILVQVGASQIWYRAGLAACLAPTNFDSTDLILDLIPEYYKNLQDGNLTSDAVGNPYIEQFIGVFGWGIDYLKTALQVAQEVNNPAVIPLNYLYNLAGTLGMPFEPEISAGTIRNALANNAALVKQRGTLPGIEAYITQLTGWGADLRLGYNQMLEDDQSVFIDPAPAAWNSTISYNSGEYVTYGQFLYVSNINSNLNNTPSGSSSNNTQWNALFYTGVTNVLSNPVTGWQNTWEPRRLTSTNQHPTSAGTLDEALGIQNRTTPTTFQKNGLMITNLSTTDTMDLRSISRTTTDITAGLAQADLSQVIGDGIPVPFVIPQQLWEPGTEYTTGAIVFFNSQPFQALKASTGIMPPLNDVPSTEWQPIGLDSRIALMISCYSSQLLNTATNHQMAMTPYVAWYDQSGAFITTLTPRNPSVQYVDVTLATAAALPAVTATGTTLTATAHGVLTVDGVAISATTQTVLVQNQAAPAQNGYYAVTTVGTGSVSFVLTRLAAPTAAQMVGSYVMVDQGTANANLFFYCTNTTTPTFGTTSITFSGTAPASFFFPSNLMFDSFSEPSTWGSSVASSTPDVGAYTWLSQAGTFSVNAFDGGCVIPSSVGTRTEALINYGIANGSIGVTLATLPQAGWFEGIVFRWSSDSNYWRCDQTTLRKKVTGSFTTVATHSTPFSAGDRMTVTMNGSTITVLRNGVQVSSASDAFNNTATEHGLIYESP